MRGNLEAGRGRLAGRPVGTRAYGERASGRAARKDGARMTPPLRMFALLAAALHPTASAFKLNIVWTSKINGKLYPNGKYGSMASASMVNTTTGTTSSSSWSTVYGGVSKVAAYVNDVRESEENVIALDLGDFYWCVIPVMRMQPLRSDGVVVVP